MRQYLPAQVDSRPSVLSWARFCFSQASLQEPGLERMHPWDTEETVEAQMIFDVLYCRFLLEFQHYDYLVTRSLLKESLIALA